MNGIETIELRSASPDDGRDAGWWTSADGQRMVDCEGLTVGEAVEQLTEELGDDAARGTLEFVALVACADMVEDTAGGVWHPDEGAAKEIAESDSPEATALHICQTAPCRGEWRA